MNKNLGFQIKTGLKLILIHQLFSLWATIYVSLNCVCRYKISSLNDHTNITIMNKILDLVALKGLEVCFKIYYFKQFVFVRGHCIYTQVGRCLSSWFKGWWTQKE
jgi:hypothetical protein